MRIDAEKRIKKRMKNRIFKLFVLLCLCGMLAGCREEKIEKIEITMIHGWGSTENDHVAMRRIYEDFEKQNPDIHVNLISMPSSADVISKVGDLLTVGEIPDIVFTGGNGRESIYNFMVQKGYALNLMPYLQEDEAFKGNVSPVILEDWITDEGKLYTVSDVLLMSGYWYNRDIFASAGISKVPGTWEEWFEACEKIKNLSGQITPIVLDDNHSAYLMAAILANEAPEEIKNVKNSFINVNSPAFDVMLEKLNKLSEYAILAGDYDYRDTLSIFNEGQSAIYINGVWANSMINPDMNVAYAAFPSNDGKGIAALSACVGYILGNTGDRERMEASVELLKYMLSDEVAERILTQTGQVPSNPHVEITQEKTGERMQQAVECVQNAGLLIQIPENLWNLSKKEEYGENVMLYLQKRISEKEFRKRLSAM